MSVFLVVKRRQSSPWIAVAVIISGCGYQVTTAQRHLTFWVHLWRDHGSGRAAAVVILMAVVRLVSCYHLSVTLPRLAAKSDTKQNRHLSSR